MSPITTHVLDTALGIPAEGMKITLSRVADDGSITMLGVGRTDADGRIADLAPEDALKPGTYRLDFRTAEYFESTDREGFYPSISVLFETRADRDHYHVPLLLSPFGYSTYRGS